MLALLYFLFSVASLAASLGKTESADYLRRFLLSNLKLLYSQGVLVEQITNVFITKTFPIQYSTVYMTGLYAESHGVVASNMFDFTTFNETDPFWWTKPRHSGYKKPWHSGEGASATVDDNVGLLLSELKRLGLWGRVNVIVTSDQGMAQYYTDRIIRLDECHHPDNYSVVDLTLAAIIPNGARCFLAGEGCVNTSLMVGLVVEVLLVLTTLTGLFKLWRPRRQSASRPFQHISIQDDDVDDADPLLD
uniref:bis(5'-adenosyl)-triphosphatase n=1 Tax=Oncorhynchus mykiss TaxID=8022 RepID=A0A8C7SRY6_ONCMY